MDWKGRIVSRTYDLDEVYLANLRLLDDDPYRRAEAHRRGLLRRFRAEERAERSTA
jgi:hypothetical protein